MNTLTHVLSSFISPITSLSLHQCLSIVSFLTLTLVQETTRGETVHQEEAGPLLLGMDCHPKSKYWNLTKSPTKTNPIQYKLKTKFVASNPIQSNYKRSKSSFSACPSPLIPFPSSSPGGRSPVTHPTQRPTLEMERSSPPPPTPWPPSPKGDAARRGEALLDGERSTLGEHADGVRPYKRTSPCPPTLLSDRRSCGWSQTPS